MARGMAPSRWHGRPMVDGSRPVALPDSSGSTPSRVLLRPSPPTPPTASIASPGRPTRAASRSAAGASAGCPDRFWIAAADRVVIDGDHRSGQNTIDPSWSPDGSWIAYVSLNRDLPSGRPDHRPARWQRPPPAGRGHRGDRRLEPGRSHPRLHDVRAMRLERSPGRGSPRGCIRSASRVAAIDRSPCPTTRHPSGWATSVGDERGASVPAELAVGEMTTSLPETPPATALGLRRRSNRILRGADSCSASICGTRPATTMHVSSRRFTFPTT